MIRTQISLDEKEYELAQEGAKKLGVSLAEFFRRSLRAMLPLNKKKPWMHYCGDVSSGNPRSSQEIDDVIYGHKE